MEYIKNIVRFIRRIYNWKIKKTAEIHRSCIIDKNTSLGKFVVIFSKVTLFETKVDDYSYIAPGATCFHCNIGKFCSIASNVFIGLPEHPTNYISTSPIFYDCSQALPSFFTSEKNEKPYLKTIIGHDVWIGFGVKIKAGINIGTGAIIGAGSIVTKDVEPYSVVAGVPAKRIKYRFEEDIRIRLLKSEWWNIENEKLCKLSEHFINPELFLQSVETD